MTTEKVSNIQELSLEAVMGERFGRYSKYIIQERALPDIRDGLKPVQRRILFAMNEDGNTYDKAFRKSAKSVGNVMGNYHPHGDSSIYEAMVRLSQTWKLREPLIEMHGNNGSMDGDSPAAMRYTESRLSKISSEMLKDIDKKTVDMVLNFDDTEYEPTVLPARFPNLLVNGATGISAGYATEIPPHNLSETIEATIYLLGHPNATLEDLMKFVKGPDFPTGGILQGIEGVKKAYETGRGKVILRSRTKIEDIRGGKQQIVVSEIPYEVNKSVLVKRIDELRLLKKVEGISEVRDESDRDGLRIVIELKKNSNSQGILNYLFKNTDLQISYNFNMVAINNKRPEHVGLKAILEAYVEHQRNVTTRRTKFDLEKALRRKHIVDGLIKALSILDEVIATIRSSKNKADAKDNLVNKFEFTEVQAEAIVSLQLYRLTNTDVTALQKEAEELENSISKFEEILSNPKKLDSVIKRELKAILKNYGNERLTEIQEKISSLKIETEVMVAQEDIMLLVSHEGYVKRSSLRSFKASEPDENGLKEEDYPILNEQANTLDHLIMFTNKGNTVYRPVHEISDSRWKDTGEHLSQSVGLDSDEFIISAYTFKDLNSDNDFLIATKHGYIKRIHLADIKPGRTYKSRASRFIKFKFDNDQVITVDLIKHSNEIFSATNTGYGLRYSIDEIPFSGPQAIGVKNMDLRNDDYIAAVNLVKEDSILSVLTHRGSFKNMQISDVSMSTRARRGVQILRELKNNPHRIVNISNIYELAHLLVVTDKNERIEINPTDYPISDRYSNGKFVFDIETQGSPEKYIVKDLIIE